MTGPSKGAAIFLTLFGLPFLGGGLFFLYVQILSRGNFRTSDFVTGAMIALVFVFVGGGLIYAAISGYGRLKKQAALEEANPLSPWVWRQDWASRRAESQHKKGAIAKWVFAILCNMFTLPFLFRLVPQLLRNGDLRVIILLGFNLLGAILIVIAVRASIRHSRFGDTYFEFNSLPFSPGDRIGGRIHLKLDTRVEHGVDVRLSCVRKVVIGSGEDRSTSRIVLWQADQNVPAGAIGPGPLGRAIPVDFPIPPDSLQTDHDNLSDQLVWQLHAQADVPGVNFSDDFEIPVFKTAASVARVRESESPTSSRVDAAGFASAPSGSEDVGFVAKPARTKVIVGIHDGGTEFYFPALRNPGRALLLFVVMVIWSGVVYMLYHSRAPFFFTVVFGLADLLLIWGFLHVTLGSARIGVSSGEILSRTGIFGIGATKRIPVSNVDSIVPVLSAQQGNSSWGHAYYAIRLRTKDGRKLRLADEIDNRQEARWIVSQIETLAGLKVDTHVEVEMPLGISAMPPQPGTLRPQPRMSAAASIAIFVLMAGAMFGWVTWRRAPSGSRRNSSRTAAASPAKSSAPRVFSGPMTDADVERVLASPAQNQAEELLERAIGHDERALELFEQNVESWVGHINESPRMKQLERRSEFSKDLRVRYANADINLTLDGWQKNEHAAELLIERARTDEQYRAAAVYFLGMLAGRGVDYDRIHPVLLDYARNNGDPTVRQWAVEGMRYLGKDEALDDLFISFTEDPSPKVRERAGCNISDCGSFTRKQRMRMVPKLIDLAANSSTSPQMRNWCFMALSGITDVNLPADAQAWSRWYAEHGGEKLAEFERLDWWQVRGDE
jgi:hypothetical protein